MYSVCFWLQSTRDSCVNSANCLLVVMGLKLLREELGSDNATVSCLNCNNVNCESYQRKSLCWISTSTAFVIPPCEITTESGDIKSSEEVFAFNHHLWLPKIQLSFRLNRGFPDNPFTFTVHKRNRFKKTNIPTPG